MSALPPFAAVVMAAGKGTRMNSDLPKVLHPLGGRPILKHLLATLEGLSPARIVVIVPGDDGGAVARAAAPHATAVQAPALGTAHAVLQAEAALAGFEGPVVMLYGADPFVSADTIARLCGAVRDGAAVAAVGFRPADPARYGRLVLDGQGRLSKVVQWADASEAERAIGLCHAYTAADGRQLFSLLKMIGNGNAKGEYYLTDLFALAAAQGLPLGWVEAPEAEVMGIDSRADLAAAEARLQAAWRAAAMAGGATLLDPQSVHLSFDTVIGRDVTIGPFVVFGPGVTVGDRVRIHAFCHLEGAVVDAGAIIGPFARLRPGAEIGEEAHIGNFVEVKNTAIGAGAKANHLSYLGDATVGAGANIGAGTITCNYDGFLKHHTEIGAGAFIGSNTALVAPLRIGAGAITGAGSVVSADVPADAIVVERAPVVVREGAAPRFRATRRARKERLAQAPRQAGS